MLDLRAQRGERRRVVAVVAREAGPRARGVEVGLVHLHHRARHAAQPGHVVLVNVAEHDEVDRLERRPDALRDQRRVEGDARVAAFHQHLVAVGVLARLLAQPHRDGAEAQHVVVHAADGTGRRSPARRGERLERREARWLPARMVRACSAFSRSRATWV